MLQRIECEAFSSNLISKHDRLFNASEREKLCGEGRNWTVCVDVVEEALKRNAVGVLCAFYKALVDTQSSGGAIQHTEIAERMKTRKSFRIYACTQTVCEWVCIKHNCKCPASSYVWVACACIRISMYPVEIGLCDLLLL